MTAPITAERLAEIEARANAATPGPWYAAHRGVMAEGVEIVDDCAVAGWDVYPENQAFISAARTDVPALVAEVRRLTAALEIARKEGAELMRARAAKVAHPNGWSDDEDDNTFDGLDRWEVGEAISRRIMDLALPLDAPGGER